LYNSTPGFRVIKKKKKKKKKGEGGEKFIIQN